MVASSAHSLQASMHVRMVSWLIGSYSVVVGFQRNDSSMMTATGRVVEPRRAHRANLVRIPSRRPTDRALVSKAARIRFGVQESHLFVWLEGLDSGLWSRP